MLQLTEEFKRQLDLFWKKEGSVLMEEYLRIFASTPETGYKEKQTSDSFVRIVESLGLTCEKNLALTGVRVRVRGEKPLPKSASSLFPGKIAWFAELDAIPCPGQKYWPVAADGATHACGHAVQMAVMVTALTFFARSNTRQLFSGEIVFWALPAEELIELEDRLALVKEGKISQLSGKQELLSLGEFKELDAALMFHALPDIADNEIHLHSPAMGFVSKEVIFHGKASHAGGAPEQGINALHAASLAWQAIQCLREGFRDEDRVRVHGIYTSSGGAVNVIPERVSQEWVVRAAEIPAMQQANHRVNCAITHAALAIGARAEITDRPGYLPLHQSETINKLLAEIAANRDIHVVWGHPFPGSTDLGDVSAVLPVVQVSIPGYASPLHSQDFRVTNKEAAYKLPYQLLSEAVFNILVNKEILQEIRQREGLKKWDDYVQIWSSILPVASK